jgi:Cu/Ag efflux protein CusF
MAAYRSFTNAGKTPMNISRIGDTGALAFALSMSVALAQQTLTGSITKIDEENGKITIQPAQGGTVGANTGSVAEDFRVQDGLIFNAVQPGDKVSFTVVDKDGVKTITELRKQ